MLEEYYEFLQGANETYYKIYDIETIGHEFGHTLWLTPGCEVKM
jgi:Zn-dependent oligopeptidase